MLQVARLAPKLLDDAAGLVLEFLNRQRHPSGGFKDRAGEPDLYYTVFGLDGLFALQDELPALETLPYLKSFEILGRKTRNFQLRTLIRLFRQSTFREYRRLNLLSIPY